MLNLKFYILKTRDPNQSKFYYNINKTILYVFYKFHSFIDPREKFFPVW